jgi:hypothetical protein
MRRKFIYDKETKEMVEVSVTYEPPSRQDGSLWNDRHYDGMRATDGTDISSRTKHREYMKRNGLTTADDFTNQWKNDAQKRAEYFTTGKGGAVNRDDIGRAIHQLESAPRKRNR